VLPQVEFAYNNSIIRSIGKSPFQISNGSLPRGVVDLALLLETSQKNTAAESFAEHTKEVHEQLHKQL